MEILTPMNSLLPADWRARRGLPPRTGRFYVERIEDGWQVVDTAYALTLWGDTKADATGTARFCRAYAKRHGDIDLGSVPYGLDDPLHYLRPDLIREWWTAEYPAKCPISVLAPSEPVEPA